MPKSAHGGSTPAKKPVIPLVVAVALALLALLVLTLLQQASSRPAYAAASDVLPDLGMAHPQDLRIRSTSDGRRCF
jgi:hypothetical protein